MSINSTQLDFDFYRLSPKYERFRDQFKSARTGFIPQALFDVPQVYLEVGSGTGQFFIEMAKQNPAIQFIAVERDRMRAKTLVKNTKKLGLSNLHGFRGNAVAALLHGIKDGSVDKLFILYPCPWPRMSQRKQRWYLHPVMPHFVRILKPGGQIVWASDQKFYIDEAEYICRTKYGLQVLQFGEIKATEGRTKFERSFMDLGQPVYELVVSKKNL